VIVFHPFSEPCDRCNARSWEVIGEFVPRKGRPQDVVECAFCGVRLRVEQQGRSAMSEPLVDTGEFRFQHGRFKGLTFAEVDAEPNGRRYLEIMQGSNEKLRERITKYLTHAASSA
jgi:hypothetical protein